MKRSELRGKTVTVLGLAREGVDLAQFLCRQGARVRVSDQKTTAELRTAMEALHDCPVEYSLGGHRPEEVLDAEALFVSPGVPQELPLLQEARRRGITVTSASQLLLKLAPCPVVGITGSSGKSTTTALVGEMFRAGGRHVLVGGNIGIPMLNRLDELEADSWLVLELSSFQLETIDRSPHIAAVTNLTPNHLDRHATMHDYASAKERIFRFQRPTDWTVLNADDEWSRRFTPPGRVLRFRLSQSDEPLLGAYLRGDQLLVRSDAETGEGSVCRASEVRLRGRHNLANLLTACAVSAATKVDLAAMQSTATTFSGIRHRLQIVGEHRRVLYVDDSIATSPERSIAALRSFDEPIVLIAGGRDKHLPMDEWARVIVQRARHVVLLGEMSGLVERAIRAADPDYRAISHSGSMDAAVAAAAVVARPGDVVLLSPGGTSFDMFADFEVRGEAFARTVGELGRQGALA